MAVVIQRDGCRPSHCPFDVLLQQLHLRDRLKHERMTTPWVPPFVSLEASYHGNVGAGGENVVRRNNGSMCRKTALLRVVKRGVMTEEKTAASATGAYHAHLGAHSEGTDV